MKTYEFKVKVERDIGIHIGPASVFVKELSNLEKEKNCSISYRREDIKKIYLPGQGPINLAGVPANTEITTLLNLERELSEEEKEDILERLDSAIKFVL